MINHYVSTYQRNYTSPEESRAQRPKSPIAIFKSSTCIDSRRAPQQLADVEVRECFDSSRTPTKLLSEPKIYLIKSRIQEVEATPFDQPRGCERTLEIQCPELYKILEKTLLDDVEERERERASRVETDRMKTTYQIDFSDPAAARMTQLSRMREMDDQQLQCSRVPVKITIEADCPPQCRPPSSRHNGITRARKYDFTRKNGPKREKTCDGRLATKLPSWKTEYQDSINKIGQTIMKVKLHQMKKKIVPVLTTSN